MKPIPVKRSESKQDNHMGDQNLKELQEAYRLLRETNEKLYNSMKAFQIAAEESGSLVFTYDTKKQAIFVDERTAEAFQVETIQTGVPYEMVKKGIISKDTEEEYIRIHEAMIAGEKEAEGIVKLIPVEGEEVVYELKFRAIFNEDGKPTGVAVGVYRNITERYVKEMEQERYQQIVYSSDRYVFQYEEEEDFLTIYSSPADMGSESSEKFYYKEYSKKLMSGKLCPERDIPILRTLFQHGANKPVQVQLYSMHTGELRWYALTAAVAGHETSGKRVFGTLADITDIKAKEVSYGKLERALRGMTDEYIGIFEIDMEKNLYTILSYGEEGTIENLPESGRYSDFMSRLINELVAEEYKEPFARFSSMEHLQQALSKEKRIEIEYMTISQAHTWRRSSYRAVEYNGDTPSKVILYQLDIDKIKTERLMQQQAMEEAYKYAEAANAAKTNFLSRMSHDIRTPMNAIIGMTAIAGTQIENHERVQECLSKITIASKHLLMLINEVLDMSKIESGKVEPQNESFNLADLIDNLITMILPQINQHGHTLQVSVKDMKHEWVVGDSLRIQQAFVNLISNAVKYTPDGGKISIDIKEKNLQNSNYAEYEFIFEDNGIGMTEEFQKKIFEPFTRAEDSRISGVTGTGLGMAITRNIIRMMDGGIKVFSKVNAGSKFVVTIHLQIQEGYGESTEELTDLPVLVVDDDAETCENVCLLLDEIGMDGEWCLSGKEAVERTKLRHDEQRDYFALIIDWKMPQMDGVATVKEIRRQVGNEVPIIIISAYDWSEIEADARAAGVDHFITKPLFKSRLIRTFKELVSMGTEQEVSRGGLIHPKDYAGKRILLVEDNDLNAEIAQEIIEMSGLLVERAENGKVAVEKIEKAEENYYDMVFMDIQMPVLNGYEATLAIRHLKRKDVKTLPIVAMTANAFVEDIDQAKSAGMDEHISKPIDIVQLEAVMQKYLNKKE